MIQDHTHTCNYVYIYIWNENIGYIDALHQKGPHENLGGKVPVAAGSHFLFVSDSPMNMVIFQFANDVSLPGGSSVFIHQYRVANEHNV